MNRKQLILVLIVGALVGTAGIVSYQRKADSWKSGLTSGKKLLPNFPLNDVAHLVIRSSSNEINLLKQDDLWTVRERYGYPANFGEIGEFLRKVWDMKAVQTEKVGPSQLHRLQLVEPGKGSNSATLVEFKDKSGKTLHGLLLGKKHMRKPAGAAASPFGDEGWPDGRYVLVMGAPGPVALINDALTSLEPKADQWLNKDFFKVEKVKSVTVTHPVASNSWVLAREMETGEFKLLESADGEKLDSSKISGMSSLLSWPSFTDVVSPEAKSDETGMDQPIVAKIETFDQFTYTVKIGKKSGEDSYHFNFQVSGAFPKERQPGQDEKPEDKEKLDKDFKEKLAKLEEKLSQEQSYGKWTYLVSKWTVDSLLKERKDLFQDKKEDSEKDKSNNGAVPAPALGSDGLPGPDSDGDGESEE